MDCARSLSLLSEYRIGALNEAENVGVKTHLTGCGECLGVFEDLNSIVQAAAVLRTTEDVMPEISFPDEKLLWQRMGLDKKTVH